MDEKQIQIVIAAVGNRGNLIGATVKEASNDSIGTRETDDDGNEWICVKEVPCPNGFPKDEDINPTPVKTGKFTYQIVTEFSVIEFLQAHSHDIYERLNPIDCSPEEYLEINAVDVAERICGKRVCGTEAETEVSLLDKSFKESITEETTQSLYFDTHKEMFEKFSQYFEKHFPVEVERLVERLFFESSISDDRGEFREKTISTLIKNEEQRLRERLVVQKGKIPAQKSNDYIESFNEFINRCLSALVNLESRNLPLNKNRLAKELYRGDNPLQSLRRELTKFKITFDEVLQEYREQKSP